MLSKISWILGQNVKNQHPILWQLMSRQEVRRYIDVIALDDYNNTITLLSTYMKLILMKRTVLQRNIVSKKIA